MFTYYSVPGGGVAYREDDEVPVGWTEITQAAYDSALATLEADEASDKAAQLLADCLARKDVYDDLVANTTLSDVTCHFLSRWEHGDC